MSSVPELVFLPPREALQGATTLVVLGPRARLRSGDVRALLPEGAAPVWDAMLAGLEPGDAGARTTTWLAGSGPRELVVGLLPDACSRHNAPAQPHAITRLLRGSAAKQGRTAVLLALAEQEHAFAAGCAVPRAFPMYSRKGEANGAEVAGSTEVAIALLAPNGEEVSDPLLAPAAEGIRLAARLVDMPTCELHTDRYLEELHLLASSTGAALEVLRGDELEAAGYGGLWNVGKAAVHPPALAILTHAPKGARETVCWVGKGIVYDTGGLSLKGKEHMPGMKGDMGGSAAVAGAFLAAVRGGYPHKLHALFCLAENAVGPESVRPDDVVRMASGKTVEINNTDAEGRLVLADGVAHAGAHLAPDVIVDLATLTGAQLVATGRRHAAIVTNDEELEHRTVRSGRASGDLVHPLPYCPEFFRKEFESKVADLKNSVKDRSNAQSSCAAQFIAENLGSYTGPWLHVDLAGPAGEDERGTGFGVALLLDLFVRSSPG